MFIKYNITNNKSVHFHTAKSSIHQFWGSFSLNGDKINTLLAFLVFSARKNYYTTDTVLFVYISHLLIATLSSAQHT